MRSTQSPRRARRVAIFGSLRVLACAAVLVAMSIVCGKYLAIRGGEVLRFSFENLPILFSGICFGPLVGLAVGVAADLIGCLLVGYAINPIVTLGAAAIGLCSGIFVRVAKRLPLAWKLALSVSLSHLLGSVVIKTLGLAAFYSMPIGVLMLWRLLNYLIVGAIEFLLIWALLKNRSVRGTLEKMKQR